MRPYHPTWHDMSDYVVHFTRATPPRTAHENMMSIYSSRVLIPGKAFGIARSRAPDEQSQYAVAFSEIPLHLLRRLAERRGPYGIGFTKEFVLSRGGGPVWYAEKDSPMSVAIFHLMMRALNAEAPESDPIWQLTPFIDCPGEYEAKTFRFEWEREWRHVGPLNFTEEDVAFLILPQDLHSSARGFFETVATENLGPAYLCPYIDPYWDNDRVRAVLSDHPAKP